MSRLLVVLACLVSTGFALKIGGSIELAPSRPNDETAAAVLKGDNGQYYMYAYAQNFHQAHEFCMQRDMRVASYDDNDEFAQLTTVLKENDGDETVGYWTSGNDLGQKDHYVFNFAGQLMSAPHWAEGQPNHDAEGSDARCVGLAGAGFQAHLVPCDRAMYVVCEKPMDPAAAAALAAIAEAVADAAES